jgi:phosphoribosylanthranilate isomerase
MTAIRTKICGITKILDAKVACEAGADAIGLNFYPKSKRFVDVKAAAEIANSIEGQIAVFGVFVNATIDDVEETCSQVQLSHIQFHGDEKPEIVKATTARISGKSIVRAVRVLNNGFEKAQLEINRWQDAGSDMILLDAGSLDSFGGTGKKLDWSQLDSLSFEVPWMLAGGLDPTNVAGAISIAKPAGVDVASGVEAEPGVKDAAMVHKFVADSKLAFAR